MKDPYKVLGVSRDATDDEIKKAYRELAKKYHPDNYADSPLADLVSEKMKEINEAYDTIQKERAGGASGYGSSSGYGYTGGYDNTYSYANTKFARVRTLINEGNYAEAEIILDSVPSAERGAEWNFLKGCVLLQRGHYFDAQRMLETACYMDPNNMEYRAALNRIKRTAGSHGGYTVSTSDKSCDLCDICSALICLDCLCGGGPCC